MHYSRITGTSGVSIRCCFDNSRPIVSWKGTLETKDAMHIQYYPMFVSVDKRECLVVGGGPVGERKIRLLMSYGAVIRLVAEKLTPWLQTQCDQGNVRLAGETYSKDHLEDVDVVFAATSDPGLNREIAADARQRRLLCNMATEPECGSFIVPSIFRRGPLTIAISTAGASPALAVQIRQKLEHEFGIEWSILLNLMSLLRMTIQSKGMTSDQNQELYHRITGLPLLEWIQKGENSPAIQAISDICHPWINSVEIEHTWNEAWKHFS